MASVYFHIPYCRKACTYCNFHFSTQLKGFESMIDAMKKDWQLQQHFIEDAFVDSIYLGGGTPSVLPSNLLGQLLNEISKTKTVRAEAEITLEANPEDITHQNLTQWNQLGINRISLGVQSLNNEELAWMNRAHNAEQSKNSVSQILETGDFELSIDLIYGSPLKTADAWMNELSWVNETNIHHLSCYALTVEEKTALYTQQKQGKLQVLDEHSTLHFNLLSEWAVSSGWLHYEISNLSRKESFKAKHNQRYWHGGQYWGIGPGAHGYNGRVRRWNISNNALYTRGILNNIEDSCFSIESLSDANRFNEVLMTRLRLLEGVSWDALQTQTNPTDWETWYNEHINTMKRWAKDGYLEFSNYGLKLTATGRWFADAITADLMMLAEV